LKKTITREFNMEKTSLFIIAFLGNAVATSPSISAQTDSAPEYYFKAAFLANFARLTEWPPDAFQNAEQPLVLCVQDPKPFGDALAEIDGKIIKGRKLTVTTCGSIDKLSGCHILFANSSDPKLRQKAARAVEKKPVLVVGEEEGFVEKGGMINFISVNNRIGFEINKTNSDAAGLKVSARLLKLSKIVDAGNLE
jgi:hypothetical protein